MLLPLTTLVKSECGKRRDGCVRNVASSHCSCHVWMKKTFRRPCLFVKPLLVGTPAKFSDEEDVERAVFVMSLLVTTLVKFQCRTR